MNRQREFKKTLKNFFFIYETKRKKVEDRVDQYNSKKRKLSMYQQAKRIEKTLIK